MKEMKKFFAALLAVMLVFSLCVTASADEPAAHSYKAFQIFSGTESATGLTGIQWGSGVGEGFLAALQADNTLGSLFTSCKTAEDVANVMSTWTDNDANAKAFAKFVYDNKAGNGADVESGSTELNAGYYLVVDTTNVSGKDDVVNLALLKQTTAGKVAFESKVDKPTVQKKVKDVNDSAADSTTAWQDSADYDFGDAVPFQLTANLKTISDYETYKVVFHDTQDAGFGVPTNFKYYIDGTEKTTGFTLNTTGNDFTVTCADVKALGAKDNSVITVEYTAELLKDTANVGAKGNWNEVYLEYSNDANNSGEGDNKTGNTPEDKVVVFTYSVVVTKKDGQDSSKTLGGAGFSLYKYNASSEASDKYELVKTFEAASDVDTFTWSGIDDGTYKLVEDTAPNGYNKMEDLVFTISAGHDTEAVEPTLFELTGGDLVTGEVDFSETGSIAADVLNFKGTVLPETGGMGTTIFYAVGGIMVVAAVVLLLTKKRMIAEA